MPATGPFISSGVPHFLYGIRSVIAAFLGFSGSSSAVFISVAMYPGARALTLIPFSAHSLHSALVSWATPPLDAAYAGTVYPPKNESIDAMLIIFPFPPCFRNVFPASWHSANTLLRFTLMTKSHSDSGKSSLGYLFCTPAPLTMISRCPPSFSTAV